MKKYNLKNFYELEEAITIVKKISKTKFDASIDISIRLGIDIKKTNHAIKNTVILPHGTGKKNKILVLCDKDKQKKAKEAGADYIGLKEYIEKIKNGWFDFNIIITTPEVMPELKKIGKILGPKGLMPNTKSETITTNLYDSIKEVKKGRIIFKTDKYGIINSSVGKISFSNKKIKENIEALINAVIKSKPLFLKNTYLKNIVISSTMSKSVIINKRNYIV